MPVVRELESSSDVSSYISNNFYVINFNGESKNEIRFNNKAYLFKSTGLNTGTHQLALSLVPEGEGISYPYWIILDEKLNTITSYKGYLKSRNLMLLLKSVAESKTAALK